MNLTILTPVRLKFTPSEFKHPQRSIDLWKWSNVCKDITGSVKAVVTDDPKKGLETLLNDARNLIRSNMSNGVELCDFELVYSTDEVKDGRCWVSGHVVRFESLREKVAA